MCTTEEQEAGPHKRAQEEEDERLARQCVVDEHERVDHQCAADEAEGSNHSGIQVSDFDVFDVPVSLEHRRHYGLSGMAGSSTPPPSVPRLPRTYTHH